MLYKGILSNWSSIERITLHLTSQIIKFYELTMLKVFWQMETVMRRVHRNSRKNQSLVAWLKMERSLKIWVRVGLGTRSRSFFVSHCQVSGSLLVTSGKKRAHHLLSYSTQQISSALKNKQMLTRLFFLSTNLNSAIWSKCVTQTLNRQAKKWPLLFQNLNHHDVNESWDKSSANKPSNKAHHPNWSSQMMRTLSIPLQMTTVKQTESLT